MNDMQTLSTSTSPYLKFEYALHAPATKRQYPKRLEVFLNFLKIKGETIEEKSNILYTLIHENGREWLEEQLMFFLDCKIEELRMEKYILDTGHFALEEDYDVIAEKISGSFSARPQIKAINKDIKA